MEGDPKVDELMRPVLKVIERHVKDSDAKTEIYNRAYEAIMISMEGNLIRVDKLQARIAELELRLDAYNGNMMDVLEDENRKLKERIKELEKALTDVLHIGEEHTSRSKE